MLPSWKLRLFPQIQRSAHVESDRMVREMNTNLQVMSEACPESYTAYWTGSPKCTGNCYSKAQVKNNFERF